MTGRLATAAADLRCTSMTTGYEGPAPAGLETPAEGLIKEVAPQTCLLFLFVFFSSFGCSSSTVSASNSASMTMSTSPSASNPRMV